MVKSHINRVFNDDNIKSNVLKFVDDPNVFRKVHNYGDKQHLQNDLDKVVKWSEKWQMLLHFGSCKCLHRGCGNLDVSYTMGDTITTVKVKDIISYKEIYLIMHLHKAIVRPHLEYQLYSTLETISYEGHI